MKTSNREGNTVEEKQVSLVRVFSSRDRRGVLRRLFSILCSRSPFKPGSTWRANLQNTSFDIWSIIPVGDNRIAGIVFRNQTSRTR